MGDIDKILSMIRKLTVAELLQLVKRLEAEPRWPGAAGASVGAKPKPGPPGLSTSVKNVIGTDLEGNPLIKRRPGQSVE